MKGLMKVCSGGLAMWRGWRGIGFPTEYVVGCAGSRSVGRPWKRWIEYCEGVFKEERFVCQVSKEMNP